MNTEKTLLIRMRRWIGISIMALIPVCLLVSLLGNRWVNSEGLWCQSMSSMYWSSARPLFIGVLSIIAIFFILYDGYDWVDKVINILSGICVICIIIFPSYSPTVLLNNFPLSFEIFPKLDNSISDKLHNIFASGLFIIQAINLSFCFTQHKGEITEKKKQRNILYIVSAIIGVVLLVINQISAGLYVAGKPIPIPVLGLIIQVLAFIDIGVAWLVKGEALRFLNDIE